LSIEIIRSYEEESMYQTEFGEPLDAAINFNNFTTAPYNFPTRGRRYAALQPQVGFSLIPSV